MNKLPRKLFQRQDESDDALFYVFPRFEKHLDDETIAALTDYYRQALCSSDAILDLMSSWISHLPEEIKYRKVTGLGMNRKELERNPRLDALDVHDLNKNPKLPYPAECFDKVLIAVSAQYLTQPFTVFKEIGRVLKKNGQCMVSLSHRLFPTKAVYAFQFLPPHQRCQVVACYMEDGAGLSDIQILDESPAEADPLWIVKGTKKG